MGLVGLCAFFWAMRHNQCDDPEGKAWRVIALEDLLHHDIPPETEGIRHNTMAAHFEDEHSALAL